MAAVAKGLTGQAAIDAIVRRFERPADPDSEIQRASGYYQRLRGDSGNVSDVSFAPTTAGWGGSQSIATGVAAIGRQSGLVVSSEKRDRQNTASGGRSDHWTGSKDSYAYDLSGSKAKMDAAARSILASLGMDWSGGPLVLNLTRNGYRLQILYRTNVGGDHYDHIHIGVRRIGESI